MNTDEKQACRQIIRRGCLCSSPISLCSAVLLAPSHAPHQPPTLLWPHYDEEPSELSAPWASSEQHTDAGGPQAPLGCLAHSSRTHACVGHSNKYYSQAIHTDFLPCHSASSVSKYRSLHLNLIRMFLGIHYPYLFLISPYQQMPAYLYQDPDKICATPVMLESSPTSAEQESLMWLDIIQISLSTPLLKTATLAGGLPSQLQRLLANLWLPKKPFLNYFVFQWLF